MPSTSPAQARLMQAAAHTPGGYDGVPQSVGAEFVQADQGKGQFTQHPRARKIAIAMMGKPKAAPMPRNPQQPKLGF